MTHTKNSLFTNPSEILSVATEEAVGTAAFPSDNRIPFARAFAKAAKSLRRAFQKLPSRAPLEAAGCRRSPVRQGGLSPDCICCH